MGGGGVGDIIVNMNNNAMVQNLMEKGEGKGKRGKGSHDADLLVATLYNEVLLLLEQHPTHIRLPEDVPKIADKLTLLKQCFEQLLEQSPPAGSDSAGISCSDCQNYEASLQKLENEVRQHIRLEQQLKIFQDSLDEKIDENKKEKRQLEKKIDSQKKQLDELRNLNAALLDKNNKLEAEAEQLRSLRRPTEAPSTRRDKPNPYESKENKIDWVHRNVSLKKDDKGEKERQGERQGDRQGDRQGERKSVEKKERGDSGEKNWRLSANTKSNKMMSIMNEKLIQDKGKDERRKAIQSKFEYRR